jgi:hypothetical protein
MHEPPAGSVVAWQFCEALNSAVGGAPPKMLIGPNGSPPVFVSVTEACAELPTFTCPKSIAVVLIAISVSTAATGPGATTNAAATKPPIATAAPMPCGRTAAII